jgi:DNA-binding response OmpR family regulator
MHYIGMKALIIDDDPHICAVLAARLPEHGFLTETAMTGKDGIQMARLNRYDVLVVDLNLPDMAGEQVVATLREDLHVPPILMFTVVSDVSSKVRLLNAGADDYLVKPFVFEELLARLRALTRRPQTVVPEKVTIGNLTLDISTQEAWRDEIAIQLTRKEFALLERLIRQQGAVISKGELIEQIWGSDADPFSDSFDTHMTNLRKKLGEPELIHTVHGRGYKIR